MVPCAIDVLSSNVEKKGCPFGQPFDEIGKL